MWDIRDGTFVRDLLTGINGVWQVVFEGRWCVAASNRADATMLDVWDFGRDDDDEDWIGEPAGGLYDDTDEEDEEDDVEQADVDAMDQDLEIAASEPEQSMGDATSIEADDDDLSSTGMRGRQRWSSELATPERNKVGSSSLSTWGLNESGGREVGLAQVSLVGPSHSIIRNPRLPLDEDTPTRPRNRSENGRRR
jgi:F-box and WD-40 domain protein CDC4